MDIKEILPTLSHAPITNLKDGKINNQDATLLLMFQSPDGVSKSPEIRQKLQAWRDQSLAFTYLFNTCESGGYGYVGKNADSTHNMVYGFTLSPAGKYYNCTTRRRTYWYRAKRGQYKLTLEGFRRLAELQAQLA